MRLLAAIIGLGLLVAGVLHARDGEVPRAAAVIDPATRARLKANLERFRLLPPETQARARALDLALYQEEDAATRARLWAVIERYAGWLSRLPAEERERIEAVPAGPDRVAAVREMLDRQWQAGLPEAYRAKLAATPQAEQPALLAQWRADDLARRRERVEAIRRIEEGVLPALRDKAFVEQLQKWVDETLDPKLTKREKQRLANIPKAQRLNYLNQVWVLSRNHGLTPPGPPDVWQRIRQSKGIGGGGE